MTLKFIEKYLYLFFTTVLILLIVLSLYTLYLNKDIVQISRIFLTLPFSIPIIFFTEWLNIFKRFLIAAIINELLRTILFILSINKISIKLNSIFVIIIFYLLFHSLITIIKSKIIRK